MKRILVLIALVLLLSGCTNYQGIIADKDATIQDLQTQVASLKGEISGHKCLSCPKYDIQLRNPTYKELTDFLATVDTSKVEPHKQHGCMDYALYLQQKSTEKGYWSKLVLLNIKRPWDMATVGHVELVYDTDKGRIFVEPKFPKEVTINGSDELIWDNKVQATILYMKVYN